MKYRFFLSLAVGVLMCGALPVSAATVAPHIGVSAVSFEKAAKPPTCKVLLTYKRPRAGDSTTLLWRSQKAEYMTGLYTTDKREAQGSQNIIFGHPGVQNFELSFVGPGGTTTCKLQVNVREKLVAE